MSALAKFDDRRAMEAASARFIHALRSAARLPAIPAAAKNKSGPTDASTPTGPEHHSLSKERTMSLSRARRNPPAVQAIPVIHCRAAKADDAFAAYTAMLEAERRDPALAANSTFAMCKSLALDAFADAHRGGVQ